MNIDYKEIDKEYKIEYIKALIANIEGQKKYNILFITFNIAVIAFLLDRIALNDLIPSTVLEYKVYFIIDIILHLLSAGLFTIWLAKIHNLSIKATDLFITLNLVEARSENYPNWGFYKKWGWINILAILFLISGILLTVILLLKCNGLF